MVPPFDWENWAGKTTHKKGAASRQRGVAWRDKGCA